MVMDELDGLLARLADLVSRDPHRAVFAPPATAEDIAAAEAQMGVPLPPSYKRFLQRFNGGFISLVGDITQPPYDQASAEWNSNALLGTERLVAEYLEQKDFWESDMDWPAPWPYVPFCQTEGQEKLAFAPMGSPNDEPQALDANHEHGPRQWHAVYQRFIALLADYLARDGEIETIA